MNPPDPNLDFADIWTFQYAEVGGPLPPNTPCLKCTLGSSPIVAAADGRLTRSDVAIVMKMLGFQLVDSGPGYEDYDSTKPIKVLDTVVVRYPGGGNATLRSPPGRRLSGVAVPRGSAVKNRESNM